MVGIEQLRKFGMEKQYASAADLIRETEQIMGFFFPQGGKQPVYSNIDELKSLKEEWDHLCN